MLINDDFIIKYFYKPDTYKFLNKEKLNNIPNNIQSYLNNRFIDSYSNEETICRIRFIKDGINVEVKPTCPVCGKPVHFLFKKTKLFTSNCSYNCKYKNENIKEKTKQTCIERYGGNAPMSSENIKEKTKQTCIERYGVERPMHLELIKNKFKETCIKKYGYDNPSKHPKVKEKLKETQYKLYNGYAFNTDKQKQTMIKKYGVDCNFKRKEIRELLNTDEIKEKRYNTKVKNNTLGGRYSKSEKIAYDLISKKFPDTIRWYKDKTRYPFECDMYIPSLDLFIECQFHQTHGKHPFNSNSKEDQEYKKMLEKYFTSNTWCVKDPQKREIAKENNLNYIEFWNINEIKEWLKYKKEA